MALKKGKGRHASILHMKKRRTFGKGLEVYAFWTGFASTLISVVQVIVVALKK